MLVADEPADQKVRRKLAREPPDGVDLRPLKIAAERVAAEIGAAHVDPGEPIVQRCSGRRRLGHRAVLAGIAERGEIIIDAFAACIERSEEALDAVLFRSPLLRNRQFERLERIDTAGSKVPSDTPASEMSDCG